MTSTNPRKQVHLRAGGVSVLFDLVEGHLPVVVHWGAEIGGDVAAAITDLVTTSRGANLQNAPVPSQRFSIVPTEWDAWSGSPGIAVHSGGRGTTPRLSLAAVETSEEAADFYLSDEALGLELRVRYTLDQSGVLTASASLTNVGDGLVDLGGLRLLMPIPARATEILDSTGQWSHERVPQRHNMVDGGHVRAVRRGRPGHDSPTLSMVGTPGFVFRSGEIWSAHVAWSGDQEYLAERLPAGAGVFSSVLGGGELVRPGEIRLGAGDSYDTPDIVFVWSDAGIDGLSLRLHQYVRSFARYPTTPRPLVLNTWEAVYFDHNLENLVNLADRAAAVGIERFVLDDGWFEGRRSDHAGLGDWRADPEVWPKGLRPLSDHVHGLGMQFGLWFEPEMVNLDSKTAREHPDWLLVPSSGPGLEWRHQYVLNLAKAECRDFLLESISALVTENSIDYIKWDHNRDLLEAVSQGGADADTPGVHAQTLAVYELLDALLDRHPGLEIESCASGGARVDLGILRRTHRVWASDTNDPLERQSIQRWTGTLIPPELVGSHVGGTTAHTTGRVTSLSFRLITALFAHSGIEWNITTRTDEEIEVLRVWANLYKEVRALLHSGITVRADLPDPSVLFHGIVDANADRGLFAWVALDVPNRAHTDRVIFPGLDPTARYRLRVRTDLGIPSSQQNSDPEWLANATDPGVDISGWVLTQAGVPLPSLNPAQALLIEVTRR